MARGIFRPLKSRFTYLVPVRTTYVCILAAVHDLLDNDADGSNLGILSFHTMMASILCIVYIVIAQLLNYIKWSLLHSALHCLCCHRRCRRLLFLIRSSSQLPVSSRERFHHFAHSGLIYNPNDLSIQHPKRFVLARRRIDTLTWEWVSRSAERCALESDTIG